MSNIRNSLGLANKVAVITGANSGIGLATVQRFLAEGAKVIAFDKKIDTVAPLTHSIKGDVTNLKDIDNLYKEVKEKYNKVDVVFANAGVCYYIPGDQVTEKDYDFHFDINAKGAYFTVQKALPLLNENASLIFNASIAASKGLVNSSLYCASKAAVRSMSRSFANELGPRGIRANTISPGPVTTPIFDSLGLSQEELKELEKNFSSGIPLRRYGRPEEIANLAAFLASDQSSYITGVEICADGGMIQV